MCNPFLYLVKVFRKTFIMFAVIFFVRKKLKPLVTPLLLIAALLEGLMNSDPSIRSSICNAAFSGLAYSDYLHEVWVH